MATGQKLRGLVGQSMDGRRKALTPAAATFVLGTTSHTVRASGWYRFILWGGGGNGLSDTRSGGSGQLYIAERALIRGQTLSVVVGAAQADSTVTLPGGEVLTAKAASGVTGGSSTTKNSPADIVVNGSNGTNADGSTGAAAPSYGDYRGGGVTATSSFAAVPGAGASSESLTAGAHGAVLMHQVRMRL